MQPLPERHRQSIQDAAAIVVAVADDLALDLVDVIAEMERYIVQETKVGDAAATPLEPGRRGYTLDLNGRLVTYDTSPAPDNHPVL